MPTVRKKTNKRMWFVIIWTHKNGEKLDTELTDPRSESSSKLFFPKDKGICGTVFFAKTKGTSGKARFMLYVVSCPSHKERHSGMSNYARYAVLIYADNFDIKT